MKLTPRGCCPPADGRSRTGSPRRCLSRAKTSKPICVHLGLVVYRHADDEILAAKFADTRQDLAAEAGAVFEAAVHRSPRRLDQGFTLPQ